MSFAIPTTALRKYKINVNKTKAKLDTACFLCTSTTDTLLVL